MNLFPNIYTYEGNWKIIQEDKLCQWIELLQGQPSLFRQRRGFPSNTSLKDIKTQLLAEIKWREAQTNVAVFSPNRNSWGIVKNLKLSLEQLRGHHENLLLIKSPDVVEILNWTSKDRQGEKFSLYFPTDGRYPIYSLYQYLQQDVKWNNFILVKGRKQLLQAQDPTPFVLEEGESITAYPMSIKMKITTFGEKGGVEIDVDCLQPVSQIFNHPDFLRLTNEVWNKGEASRITDYRLVHPEKRIWIDNEKRLYEQNIFPCEELVLRPIVTVFAVSFLFAQLKLYSGRLPADVSIVDLLPVFIPEIKEVGNNYCVLPINPALIKRIAERKLSIKKTETLLDLEPTNGILIIFLMREMGKIEEDFPAYSVQKSS
ncbi:MAG: hypothetical protein AB1422_00265 [bacterium]